MQLVTPLLSTSDHQRSGGNNNKTSSNSVWEKLKNSTHQIVEELTAPPTVGAVSSESSPSEEADLMCGAEKLK